MVQLMTYENAENEVRKNCRKWQMSFKAKMPKQEIGFSQKRRKWLSASFHRKIRIFDDPDTCLRKFI
jgi:hypothetical protein